VALNLNSNFVDLTEIYSGLNLSVFFVPKGLACPSHFGCDSLDVAPVSYLKVSFGVSVWLYCFLLLFRAGFLALLVISKINARRLLAL
jgi:hypothetical protein